MCPCHQDDGSFATALLAVAAIVFAAGILRGHWSTMKTGSRILGVVATALVACLALVFGSWGNRSEVCRLLPQSDAATTAPAIDPPAAGAAAVPESRPGVAASDEVLPFKVMAYYFHRTLRCHTCLTIEELSKQAVENGYAGELAGGFVEWRSINIEEGSNAHFVEDFDLTAPSLVLVRLEDGRQTNWKKLEAVWQHVADPGVFDQYDRSELEAFLYGDAVGQQ